MFIFGIAMIIVIVGLIEYIQSKIDASYARNIEKKSDINGGFGGICNYRLKNTTRHKNTSK